MVKLSDIMYQVLRCLFVTSHERVMSCFDGAAVRASDFRSNGRVFDIRPGRNQDT